LKTGGHAPAAMNAANEVAVAAFLDRRIGFLDIASVAAEALDRDVAACASNAGVLEAAMAVDRRARRAAEAAVARRGL
jgi:1-deoxy-D-xylulose-5-phosphate reductoisomerase